MRRNKTVAAVSLMLIFAVLAFQNCSKTGFGVQTISGTSGGSSLGVDPVFQRTLDQTSPGQAANSANLEPLVIVIAGQSNATGFGQVNSLTSEQKLIPGNVDYYFEGVKRSSFSNERDDNGDGSFDFGLEVGLAQGLSQMLPSRKIVLIKTAVAGAPIQKWLTNYTDRAGVKVNGGKCFSSRESGDCKDHLGHDMHSLKDDIDQVLSRYPNARKMTFVWMQGEGDAVGWQQLGPSYRENFNQFQRRVVSELGFSQIVVGRIYSMKTSLYPVTVSTPESVIPLQDGINHVREMQSHFPEFFPGVLKVVNTDRQSLQDYYHFNSASYLALGKCFANAISFVGPYFDCDTNGSVTGLAQLSDGQLRDDVDIFLKDSYRRWLHRDPDFGGYQYWAKQLITRAITQEGLISFLQNVCSNNQGTPIAANQICQFGNSCIQRAEAETLLATNSAKGFSNCRIESLNECVAGYGALRAFRTVCDDFTGSDYDGRDFIFGLYTRYFLRSPDLEGYNYWSNDTSTCAPRKDWTFKTHAGCRANCNVNAPMPACQ